MCPDFHGILPSQQKDPLQTSLRFQGGKREEEVDESVTPSEQAVHNSAIETVAPTLLTRLKGKISPNEQPLRQQLLNQDVGAKVGVMMAIEAIRGLFVKTLELVHLCRNHVLERANEPWMKDNASQRMP